MTRHRGRRRPARFTRRDFLATFGLGGVAVAVAAACGGSEGSGVPAAPNTAPAEGAAATGGASDTPVCVLTPEATEGPFYFDTEMLRRDITEDRVGAPLTMGVHVMRVGETCEPLPDALVDIWHTDAGGAYSGYGGQPGGLDTSGETFLRGIQVTDGDGVASFETIYPGWYPGRTVHVHFKVHHAGTTFATSQFYFDDDTTDQVYLQTPYRDRPDRSTRNDNDDVLRGDPAEANLLASVVEDGDGYAGTITVGVAVPRP